MRTMTEIGKAIEKDAVTARKQYIINYLHHKDITHHAGTRLEDMSLRDLEPIYIKEKVRETGALSE